MNVPATRFKGDLGGWRASLGKGRPKGASSGSWGASNGGAKPKEAVVALQNLERRPPTLEMGFAPFHGANGDSGELSQP